MRAVVLDGVAPTDMSLPVFAARDAQRSLDKMLVDCERDAACKAAYPGLGERVRALFARLEKERPRVRLVHPRTGIAEDVEVRASMVAGMIFGALYSPFTSSVLPSLLERAEQNDFQGLLALAFISEGAVDNMSLGMQLSVLCSEDSPRYTSGDLQRESAGTVFGSGLMMGQARACEFWPKGKVDPSLLRAGAVRRADAGAVGRSRPGHAADLGPGGHQAPDARPPLHDAGHRPRGDGHGVRQPPDHASSSRKAAWRTFVTPASAT